MGLRNHVAPLILLALLAVDATYVVTQGISVTKKNLYSTGRLKKINVEVYWDAAATQIVEVIEWGDLIEPGDIVLRLIYIKNTGRAPITLSLNASYWNPPEVKDFLSLGWNYDGSIIGKGAVIPVNMTLTVDPGITDIDAFSFLIEITGTG